MNVKVASTMEGGGSKLRSRLLKFTVNLKIRDNTFLKHTVDENEKCGVRTRRNEFARFQFFDVFNMNKLQMVKSQLAHILSNVQAVLKI